MRVSCINISGLMKCLTLVLAVCLLLAAPTSRDSSAQDTPVPAGMRAPIVLNDDDVPAFPEPPEGIDVQRECVAGVTLEMIEYECTTVGTTRKMQVSTPPVCSTGQPHPMLY